MSEPEKTRRTKTVLLAVIAAVVIGAGTGFGLVALKDKLGKKGSEDAATGTSKSPAKPTNKTSPESDGKPAKRKASPTVKASVKAKPPIKLPIQPAVKPVAKPAPRPKVNVKRKTKPDSTTKQPDPGRPTPGPRPGANRDEVFSDALLNFAHRRIESGWNSVREDRMPRDEMEEAIEKFKKAMREQPFDFGIEAAKAKNKADLLVSDSKNGGAVRILKAIEERNAGPVVGLVKDSARFAPMFKRASDGPILPGENNLLNPDKVLRDGATLKFGEGIYRVRNPLQGFRKKFPRDVVISGSGMDNTLLYIYELTSSATVPNLHIQDCTILVGASVTNFRGDAAVLRMERVRLIGFDTGSGGSSAFKGKAAAIHMVDCRIEGGYGRLPGSGVVFEFQSNALLVRCDRCTFNRVELLPHAADRSTLLFFDCIMDKMLEDPRKQAEGKAGIRFQDCQISISETRDKTKLKRDTNELFPDWQKRLKR